jgi:spermidine synthase
VSRDTVLERVELPDGKEMVLTRWDDHIAISVGGRPLMSTHEHGSEDELGRLVARCVAHAPAPRVLIGGLGLGYTLRAALDVLPRSAHVVVAELVPAVVRWNRGAHGVFAKRPLRDRRVELVVDDVAKVIARRPKYDAILLDVDNGPDALVHEANAGLYKRTGLLRARAALRRGGVLAVWSAFASNTFTRWLEEVGFEVEKLRAAPTTPGGPRYYIWVARVPASGSRPAPPRRSASKR